MRTNTKVVIVIMFIVLLMLIILGVYLMNYYKTNTYYITPKPFLSSTPTPSPSPTSEVKSAVLGEDFLITLQANPSTGYSWEAQYDKNYLALRSKDFVQDKTSNPDMVGAGGTEVFTFAPIKSGNTIITMKYKRSWEKEVSETKEFKYKIVEKENGVPINNSKCNQKAKVSETCSKAGYEFDSNKKKCVVVNGAGCNNLPFGTIEECQKTCETSVTSEGEIQFETIEKEFYNQNSEKKNYVIKNYKEWSNLWTKIGFTRIAPYIDFDNYIIIAVFQGEYPTGGYNIEITKIVENKNNIEVFVKEVSPSKKCIVTQAFTAPYHIVKLQKSDKKIVFNVEMEVNDCR